MPVQDREAKKIPTSAIKLKAKYARRWLSLAEVVGVGIGEDAKGEEHLLVYVKAVTPGIRKVIPKEIQGVKVNLEPVGIIRPRAVPS